jgi:site-specific DNA recombinase
MAATPVSTPEYEYVPLAIWPCGQTSAQYQRAGRYLPGCAKHPGKMLPELARRLVAEYSQPGSLVVDPMCGIGTTLIEGAALGRRCVGVELEARWADLADANLAHMATVTRISTDEVNQPYSLEAQANGLEQFVGSQPGMTITHRFVDKASGATLDRPGLQQALDAARTGAFDVLLVYRIDRLTRSIVGLMTIVEELEAAGVALKSATEPIDTQGPVGRMLLQLLGIFAEFERSLLIDRITAGFERKAAPGEWLGGPAPYGYALDSATKTLTANADETAVVQAIFAKYVDERLGAKAIANWLNDTGRRTRSGNLWTGQAALRLLRNPVYLGKIRHDETTHDGKHDAILDDEVFEQAQDLLDEQAAEAVDRAAASDYLLSGLTRCTTCCGGAYIGAGAQGKNRYYRYYVCRSRQTKGVRLS